MTNTIIATLITCGFVTPDQINARVEPCDCAWGRGAWVSNGTFVTVKALGGDLYRINYRRWWWDGGDNEGETREVVTLHGALALQYLFERLPLWSRW